MGGGTRRLFDGMCVYLVKNVLSQICVDGCEALWRWYRERCAEREGVEVKTPNADLLCDICCEGEKEFMFNCGHCCCEACKVKLVRTAGKCHVCRARIMAAQRIFF